MYILKADGYLKNNIKNIIFRRSQPYVIDQ